MTQLELAVKSGVGPDRVSRWENGKGVPQARSIGNVAAALGVSVATLLGIPEKPPKTLYEARLAAGVSVNAAAAAIGRARSTYHRWEQGRFPPSLLEPHEKPTRAALARTFYLTVPQLTTILRETQHHGFK